MRADYGIDAPNVVRNLILIGIVLLIIGSVLIVFFPNIVVYLLGGWAIIVSISLLATGMLMIWSSKHGKLQERERLLNTIVWRGDETVVDIGCGRGLLLNAAARRVPRGKAIGIDIWNSNDQSGNRLEQTLANAEAEGVREYIELKTADMRQLPFPDKTVDVIISSLAIHNIHEEGERRKALDEIDRVLKDGGKIAILDFQNTEEYHKAFTAMGWSKIDLSPLRFGMFPPVRWLTGEKSHK